MYLMIMIAYSSFFIVLLMTNHLIFLHARRYDNICITFMPREWHKPERTLDHVYLMQELFHTFFSIHLRNLSRVLSYDCIYFTKWVFNFFNQVTRPLCVRLWECGVCSRWCFNCEIDIRYVWRRYRFIAVVDRSVTHASVQHCISYPSPPIACSTESCIIFLCFPACGGWWCDASRLYTNTSLRVLMSLPVRASFSEPPHPCDCGGSWGSRIILLKRTRSFYDFPWFVPTSSISLIYSLHSKDS